MSSITSENLSSVTTSLGIKNYISTSVVIYNPEITKFPVL